MHAYPVDAQEDQLCGCVVVSLLQGGRLGWLVASSVAIAASNVRSTPTESSCFSLRAARLQHRLPATARPTKDVDGLVRGDLDAFFLALEDALAEPWGSLTLRRGEVEVVRPAGPRHPRRDRHALSDCAEDPRGL
jgi:hypothetical protein